MPTLAQVSYLLKNVYLGEVVDQFPKDQLWLSLLERDSRFLTGGGNQAIWPIHDERNTGGGATPSEGTLIPPGQQNGAQANQTLQDLTWGVLLSEKVIHAAKSSEQAFENVMTYEMERVMDDMKNDISRQCWGDTNGVLGTISAITGGGPYTITLSTTAVPRYFPLTRFIRNSQLITVLNSDYSAVASQVGVTVSSVSDAAGTFTLPTNTNLAVGQVITKYQANTNGNTGPGNELQGIRGIFGSTTSTIFAINPSVNPRWIPGYLSTNNTDPTEQVLGLTQAYLSAYGTAPTLCVTHPLAQVKYKNSLLTYKRVVFEGGNAKIKGGVEGMKEIDKLSGPEIADIGPMLSDNTCPLGTDPNTAYLWMGNPKHMFFQEAGDLHWMEEDGKILKFLVGNATVASPSSPKYVGYLAWYLSLCCDKRNSGALLTSVNIQL